MAFEGIKFPVYRRYRNGRSYFKILNESSFEEIQLIGAKRILKTIQAGQYPERLFIRDLVLDFERRAEEISAEDYEKERMLTG